MNNHDGLEFIRGYFNELFTRRNINALDEYLAPDYFDDDIGDPSVDHLQNSKEYIKILFEREPSIDVEVVDAMCHDDVITAFLEWYRVVNGSKASFRKGIAIFELSDRLIKKRHTYIYQNE